MATAVAMSVNVSAFRGKAVWTQQMAGVFFRQELRLH